METLNISEKKNKIKWDYDAEADILYISFGNPKTGRGSAMHLFLSGTRGPASDLLCNEAGSQTDTT